MIEIITGLVVLVLILGFFWFVGHYTNAGYGLYSESIFENIFEGFVATLIFIFAIAIIGFLLYLLHIFGTYLIHLIW